MTSHSIKGVWVCTGCDNVEPKEREVMCWACGKGQMIYRSAAEVAAAFRGPSADIFYLRPLDEAK